MSQLAGWLDAQARREAGVVRLEDALLANRFGRYFFYRLRFLFARTAVSTVIHAVKVVLLLGAFPRAEFVFIIIAQASVALISDFWWGALEEMRGQIRVFQRRKQRHLVPREIGRWLSLSAGLSAALIIIGLAYGAYAVVTGGLDAVEAIVVALLIGAGLDFVVRTYHSGAYALRRVYRPLPSLLALDVVSVGTLLVLFPFIGIWAFPVAELAAVLVVAAISLWYTTRTYRTLALPTLLPLLRERLSLPRPRALRAALVPGISYALVGLEGLVVVAGIAAATSAAGIALVILLAALAPVLRASFEWARLLYFDLKRLDLPLLAGLRRRFDRAVVRLALLIGVATGLLAAVVSAFVAEPFTPLLIVALVALLTVRSVLAAAQMQAFTRTAYLRLSVAGFAGVLGVVACFALPASADIQLLAVAAVLALSLLLLVALPAARGPREGVVPFTDWLSHLRATKVPVTITRLHFDDRRAARGTTAEARRAEEWRQGNVAHRLGAALARRGGAATWVSPRDLWTFAPRVTGAEIRAEQLSVASGGLIDAAPQVDEWSDPAAAAVELAGDGPSRLPSVAQLLADFERRFPTGIAYDTNNAPPTALTEMASRGRVDIYRAAMRHARDDGRARSGRGRRGGGQGANALDVSALVEEGSLRAIFAVDSRTADAASRNEWQHIVRAWSVRAAAGVPVEISTAGYALAGKGPTALTDNP